MSKKKRFVVGGCRAPLIWAKKLAGWFSSGKNDLKFDRKGSQCFSDCPETCLYLLTLILHVIFGGDQAKRGGGGIVWGYSFSDWDGGTEVQRHAQIRLKLLLPTRQRPQTHSQDNTAASEEQFPQLNPSKHLWGDLKMSTDSLSNPTKPERISRACSIMP